LYNLDWSDSILTSLLAKLVGLGVGTEFLKIARFIKLFN
jgi:hypothetical protein